MKVRNYILTASLMAGLFIANSANAQSGAYLRGGNTGAAGGGIFGFKDPASTQNIDMRTKNVTRMFISNNGNIGIGNSAPAQKLDVTGNIKASGTVIANGGNSNNWNTAFGWGNHATAGYLTAETDPQVGANTTSYVPKWNGSALVTSNLYSTGTFVGINTTTGVGAGNFIVKAPATTGFGGMYVTMDGTSGRKPFYGYNCAGGSTIWHEYDEASSQFRLYNGGYNFVVDNTGKVGLGTVTPAANRLDVAGVSSSEPVVNVNNATTGINVDIRGIQVSSVTNPGYGFGLQATGGYMGVYGYADASTYTGGAFGVYGYAGGSSSVGTRYGVYGYAYGGADNWGGYFPVKTYASELRVGGTQGATGYVAAINGKLIATEVRVELQASWPDYVFSKEHKLMPLEDLEEHVTTEKHLPGIPSACDVEDNGIMLGEMQTKTIEKVEELTLYLIQLNKENKELKARIEKLENK
ncbi:MAG: hypothetical protein ABI723_04545 [Bacteroidia bacterium]